MTDTTAPTAQMPAVFLGHGNPMNALETNRFTQAWSDFAALAPRPRAILSISAHWYTNATAVTAMDRPRTIHDFYGFPDELFAVDYPAAGAPEVAAEIAEVVKPRWMGLDHDSWGLDHGTWSVLTHMYPAADIPVIQLSINALQPIEDHLDLAVRLAPLRAQGILVVASGNVVHNLRRVQWDQPDSGTDWARRFDETATAMVKDAPEDILRLLEHPDYDVAVPTPDHFIPFLYLAGLATASAQVPEVVVEGYSLGSISMTCHALEALDEPPPATSTNQAAGTGQPSTTPQAPPVDSNI